MIGQRLRTLRLAHRMSLEALAAEIGGIVTKQALSKYEQDKAQPSSLVLNKLAGALGVKTAYLWSEPSISVKFIAYRKGAGLLKREQEAVEGLVTQALEDRVYLQELTMKADGSKFRVRSLPSTTPEDAEGAAETLRSKWNLGLAPIASVTDVLEDNFVHVLEIEASEKFDGNAAVAYSVDGQQVVAAAIVTRSGIPGERQRLNLAHELGHLVLNVPNDADEEKIAFRFAGAFLAPAETVLRDVGSQRSFIGFDELLILKQRFGMSVQALLYRLHDLGIVNDFLYRQRCIAINGAGWRKKEPCELPREQPKWLCQNIFRALGEGLLTAGQAERMLGEPVEAVEPLSLRERRAFMKLSMEERRRILQEQAAKMSTYYEQDLEREDLQSGDFVDH